MTRSAPKPLKLRHLFIRVARSVYGECEVLVCMSTCGVGVCGQPEARSGLLWFALGSWLAVRLHRTRTRGYPARHRRLTAYIVSGRLRAEQKIFSLYCARAGVRLLSRTATKLAGRVQTERLGAAAS